MQARGAFLSRVNVLRVMGPAQGAQVRILPPNGLGCEALALGSARQEARAARAPGGRVGPAGSHEGSRRSPWARLWRPSSAALPAARPNPRPGRGAATGWVWRARRVGPAGAPPRSSWHPPDPAACVRTWGARIGPLMPWLGLESEASWVSKKRSRFWGMFQQKVLPLNQLYTLNLKQTPFFK